MRKQEGEKRLDKKREENKVRGGKRGSHVEDLIPQSAHVSLPYLLLLPQLLLSHSPIHPALMFFHSDKASPPPSHSISTSTPPPLFSFVSHLHPLELIFSPSQSNPSFACSHLHLRLHASSPLTPRNGALLLSFSSTSARHPPSVLVYDPCTTLADSLCSLPNPDIQAEWPFCRCFIIQGKNQLWCATNRSLTAILGCSRVYNS